MKTFTRGLVVVFFLLSVTVIYGQDEIYNEKPKKEIVVESNNTKVNEKDLNNYITEKDYKEKEDEQKNKEVEVFTEENPREKDQRRDNNEAAHIAVEIVFEIFIHAVFIVTTLWN